MVTKYAETDKAKRLSGSSFRGNRADKEVQLIRSVNPGAVDSCAIVVMWDDLKSQHSGCFNLL